MKNAALCVIRGLHNPARNIGLVLGKNIQTKQPSEGQSSRISIPSEISLTMCSQIHALVHVYHQNRSSNNHESLSITPSKQQKMWVAWFHSGARNGSLARVTHQNPSLEVAPEGSWYSRTTVWVSTEAVKGHSM